MNSIRGAGDVISDDTMLSKVLRTLLLIYANRVSIIQELRFTHCNDLTLDGLVGRLTEFELSNFDNYSPTRVKYYFLSSTSP